VNHRHGSSRLQSFQRFQRYAPFTTLKPQDRSKVQASP
jgi:hypothetical protein